MSKPPDRWRGLIYERRGKALEMLLAGVDAVTVGRTLSAWPEHTANPLRMGYGWELLARGASLPPTDSYLAQSVRKDKDRVLVARSEHVPKAIEDYRAFHEARLERLLAGVWGAAIRGDVPSSLQALRILERQARLRGLPSGQGAVQGEADPRGVDEELQATVRDLIAAVDEVLPPAVRELRTP